MNAFTSNASLMIYPQDSEHSFEDTESITSTLLENGLIGTSINNHDRYYVGEQFLDLIAFMGCAPNIRLAPEESGETFTHVRLISTPDKITAFTSNHSHAPHCPNCKKPEKDWQKKLTTENLECANCGISSSPWLFNWRRSAGFGHFFIEISEIYPQEAIPQQNLLSALEQSHGVSWNYFYLYP